MKCLTATLKAVDDPYKPTGEVALVLKAVRRGDAVQIKMFTVDSLGSHLVVDRKIHAKNDAPFQILDLSLSILRMARSRKPIIGIKYRFCGSDRLYTPHLYAHEDFLGCTIYPSLRWSSSKYENDRHLRILAFQDNEQGCQVYDLYTTRRHSIAFARELRAIFDMIQEE